MYLIFGWLISKLHQIFNTHTHRLITENWFLHFVSYICVCARAFVCVLKLIFLSFQFLRMCRYYIVVYRNASYVRSIRLIPSKTYHDSHNATAFVRFVSRIFIQLKAIAPKLFVACQHGNVWFNWILLNEAGVFV